MPFPLDIGPDQPTSITFAADNDEPPHPVLALPFVREATEAERANGLPPRRFRAVNPTRAYGADCGTGARYARLALDYMVAAGTPYLLQWAVFDTMRLGREHTGIEVGFMSAFGRIAAEAHARQLTLGAGELA